MRALALLLAEGTWWETFARWVTAALWLFLECHGGEWLGLVAYCLWFQRHDPY